MEYIEWSDDYCIGNNLLDIHHKLFFEMIRDLSKKMDSNDTDIEAKEIVQFLQDYINMHFDAEEKIMNEIHFPEAKNHQAIHRDFSLSIQRLNKELYNDEVSHILDKILSLTQSWFLHHILHQDKQFSEYLH